MSVKWKKTRFPGVRYYEHKSRKHGIQKDKYFAIRYQRNGKRKEEGLGWSSDGWTASKATLELSELKKAYATGQGAISLEEKRLQSEKQRESQRAKEKKNAREQKTFSEIFLEQYYPRTKSDKAFKSHQRELGLFENWIEPLQRSKNPYSITAGYVSFPLMKLINF
ncbi:MAG: hypothetical protein JRJ27_15700 [Deltaproteobacteria bacterium]|nr:hypothetical protein [Deltaproteobacteria bacterium]